MRRNSKPSETLDSGAGMQVSEVTPTHRDAPSPVSFSHGFHVPSRTEIQERIAGKVRGAALPPVMQRNETFCREFSAVSSDADADRALTRMLNEVAVLRGSIHAGTDHDRMYSLTMTEKARVQTQQSKSEDTVSAVAEVDSADKGQSSLRTADRCAPVGVSTPAVIQTASNEHAGATPGPSGAPNLQERLAAMIMLARQVTAIRDPLARAKLKTLLQ